MIQNTQTLLSAGDVAAIVGKLGMVLDCPLIDIPSDLVREAIEECLRIIEHAQCADYSGSAPLTQGALDRITG